MLKRELAPVLTQLSKLYPSVVVLGPRQSGKTTLVKTTFPEYTYLSLEDLSIRERAAADPKGFLLAYKDAPGLILDEFQRLPELLSYIQLLIDEAYRPGYFILTGSQNFLFNIKFCILRILQFSIQVFFIISIFCHAFTFPIFVISPKFIAWFKYRSVML